MLVLILQLLVLIVVMLIELSVVLVLTMLLVGELVPLRQRIAHAAHAAVVGPAARAAAAFRFAARSIKENFNLGHNKRVGILYVFCQKDIHNSVTILHINILYISTWFPPESPVTFPAS